MRPAPPALDPDAAWQALWSGKETPAAPSPRPVSDTDLLRDLFGTARAERRNAELDPRRDGWPGHNYNAAYDALAERQRRVGARRPEIVIHRPLELWEVDDEAITATREPRDPPAPPAPVLPPYAPAPREPSALPLPPADPAPAAWLDLLARNAETPQTTEAQMLRTLAGGPRRVTAPLFELTDRLFAQPAATRDRAATRRVVVHVAKAAPATERSRIRPFLVALCGLAVGVTIGAATILLFFA